MSETYTSGVWQVKPGQDGEFVDAWREFAEWAKRKDGCGTLRLVRDVEERNRFMSFAPWDSFESQRVWKELEEFRPRIGRVLRHVDQFTPSTYELVTTVE